MECLRERCRRGLQHAEEELAWVRVRTWVLQACLRGEGAGGEGGREGEDGAPYLPDEVSGLVRIQINCTP